MVRLTPLQRAAVEATEREVLVIAGAGAGKTRVLVERIKWLLDHGVSASDILCLTFTRKAAGELKDRLETSLPGESQSRTLSGILLGTFHSVALRVLRTDGDKLGYDTDTLTILDPADAGLLLEQVCRDLGYLADKTWRRGVTWKALQQYRERFYSGQTQKDEWPYPDVLRCYHDRMKELNSLDFGMILVQCQRLFADFPAVLARWRARIKHVLVDELQDSDEIQYNLHWFFVVPGKTTFFGVGDTRQTIYRWRGARPDLMTERHPDARVIHLQDCFRCGESIVQAANSLIERNHEPLAEPMIENPVGKPSIVELEHGRSADIAAHVRLVHEREGFAWGDIAVLTRANRAARRLEDVFGEAEIPCYRVGSGFDVCDTDEFRLLHAALRLCVNPRDNLAFLRLVEALGLSPAEYAAVRQRAAERGISHLAALGSVKHRPTEPLVGTSLEGQLGLPLDCRPPVQVQVRSLAGALPISSYDGFKFWAEHCEGMAIPDALRWFALLGHPRDNQDDMPDGNVVTISTIHSAKGLEWPCVVVAGLNDGELPSGMSKREGSEGIRDERRVFYVAATRAAERLSVFYREKADQNPKRKIRPPSPFLAEAGLIKVSDGAPAA